MRRVGARINVCLFGAYVQAFAKAQVTSTILSVDENNDNDYATKEAGTSLEDPLLHSHSRVK